MRCPVNAGKVKTGDVLDARGVSGLSQCETGCGKQAEYTLYSPTVLLTGFYSPELVAFLISTCSLSGARRFFAV